jgi:hypothetical protein
MVWLALLALLVQCLLPTSYAFAMSKASQDVFFAQSICSYSHHSSAQTADQTQNAPGQQSDRLPPCPVCQAGSAGGGLALSVQLPIIVHLAIPTQSVGADLRQSTELSSASVFDPASPRGPPAFF